MESISNVPIKRVCDRSFLGEEIVGNLFYSVSILVANSGAT